MALAKWVMDNTNSIVISTTRHGSKQGLGVMELLFTAARGRPSKGPMSGVQRTANHGPSGVTPVAALSGSTPDSTTASGAGGVHLDSPQRSGEETMLDEQLYSFWIEMMQWVSTTYCLSVFASGSRVSI